MDILNQFAPFISEAIEIGIVRDLHLITYGKFLIKLWINLVKKLSFLALNASWLTFKDLVKLALLLACIIVFVIIISFIKSLKPRYNFYRLPDAEENQSSQIESQSLLNDPNANARPPDPQQPVACFFNRIKFLLSLGQEYQSLNQICSPAISDAEIQSVYKGLPWSQTQIDLESVNWLNQTLMTVWPSLKSLLKKLVFNELLKPKDSKSQVEGRKLAKKTPKLSLLISCRRRLDLLRRSKTLDGLTSRSDELFHRGALSIILFFVKLAAIYLKQFLTDVVINTLLKRGKTNDKSFTRSPIRQNIDLKQYIVKQQSKTKPITNRCAKKSPDAKDKKSRQLICVRKLRSDNSTCKVRQSHVKRLKSTMCCLGANKILKNRKKFANIFKQLNQLTKKPNEMTIERIKLGKTIPKVSGIKLIGKDSDCYRDLSETLIYKFQNQDSKIMLLSEVTYESDRQFSIKVNSLPMLGRVSIVKLAFQLRFLVTLNHTTTELNKDLKIFQTPHDVLFPAINYMQLTIMDTPRIDWQLERPQGPKRSPNQVLKRVPGKKFITKLQLLLADYIKKLTDPVNVMNHSYFKYLFHSLINMSLKWFRPFDIKIGDKFYIKTVP